MLIALSPFAFRTYTLPSGQSYISDKYGIISSVLTFADMTSLISAGCTQLSPAPTNMLGYLIGANFNVTTDQQFTMLWEGKYRVTKIVALNTSDNGMNTAVGGIYTAASKGGSALVANTQVYTGLTNANTALDLTLALPNLILNSDTPLFFSLTTPQSVAATADLFIYGENYYVPAQLA